MKSNVKVQPSRFQGYERWRAETLGLALRESGPGAVPTERLLQLIWLHQRLRRDALRTFDGRPVTVLHPGFWNREPGPDFRGAVVQLGEERPETADVEVDLVPAAWHQHGHDRNPAFRGVRLHVVWREAGPVPSGLPTVALCHALDATLEQLRDSFGGEGATPFPAALPGDCAPALAALPASAVDQLLLAAARTRLRLKADRLAARARQSGWEQALWEGLFAALGYKHNPWPMRRLAELIPRLLADFDGRNPTAFEIQVRLLGLGGLLPEPRRQGSPALRAWLGDAWDLWWRWRGAVTDLILPPATWRRAGVRPANQPARRLALAAHWLATPDWPRRWEAWLAAEPAAQARAAAFNGLLEPGPDPFWEQHWSLTCPPLTVPRPLLGTSRATDLAMNVILPWLWGRAEAGNNPAWRERAATLYLTWPPAQDNVVLRLARQRLLGIRPLPQPRRAAQQQGLQQIVRDFCATANALCEGCRLPGLLDPTAP